MDHPAQRPTRTARAALGQTPRASHARALAVSYITRVEPTLTGREVHIRREPTCLVYKPDHNGECLNCDGLADAHEYGHTYCGARGESVSIEHWFDHIVPHRESCCAQPYERLCPACKKLIPFEEHP